MNRRTQKTLPDLLNTGKKRNPSRTTNQYAKKLTTTFNTIQRLDKPVSKRLTECPFCGHRMRKQWDACPKCKRSLIKESLPTEKIILEDNDSTIVDAEVHFIDNNLPPTPPTSHLKPKSSPNKKQGYIGCLAIMVIFFLIGSYMFDSSKKETTPLPSATVSSMQANTTVPASPKAEETQQTPVSLFSSAEQTASAQQTQQQPAQTAPPQSSSNEKEYYGNGPNGEGIKGHIDNERGTKIYHLPGDRYYNKTTHVAQWFFTEKDAQAAGYRHIYK